MKKYSIFCLSMLMSFPLAVAAQDEVDDEMEEETVVTRIVHVRKVEPTREITGRVLGQADGQPLAGVLVQSVAGEGYSVLTEEDGTFKLNVPLYSTSLRVTLPGFNMVRVGLNDSGNLRDIVLQSDHARALYSEDDNILNMETANRLEYSAARNITDEVGNQLGATVHSLTRSGVLGIGSYLTMGGVNSLSSNTQPLIVLDGIIIDQQYEREMLHSGFYNDILTNVNVNDIESVEVLQNGTSIYGAKGANGVILIKTKRSKSMATRIDATINVGYEMMPKMYSMMNGPQYKNYASELLQSTGTNLMNFKFLNADPTYYWYNKYNNNTDWSKEVYRNAMVQNYGLTVQGGGEVAMYMLAVGYTHDNSTLKANNLNRLNIRFNTDIKLSNKVDLNFDLAYTNQNRKLQESGAPETYDAKSIASTNFLAMAKSPMLSPYSYAGEIYTDENGRPYGQGQIYNAHLDVVDEDYLDEINSLSKANYRLANPAAINHYGTAENKNYYDNSYVNILARPTYHINKHLVASSMFSLTLVDASEIMYLPVNGVPDYYVAELQGIRENQIEALSNRQTTINSDTKIDWKNNYNGHNIHLLGGFRLINENFSMSSLKGYNTKDDKTPTVGSTVDKLIHGTDENWSNLNWYAQAQYNYQNRYYLEGAMSMETNSQFGRDVKNALKLCGVSWGLFPSIQAGWVVTNEKFFDVNGIDYLKFTAGYNVSGNDHMRYDANRTYFRGDLYLNSVAGIFLDNIGNTSLQWETTKRFNAGFQLNALNNRVGVKFNYFHSWTDNLLTFQELGFVSGLDYNWTNGGSLKNQGFDASLTAHLVSHKDWNWSVGASMGHYVNEVTKLPDNKQFMDTQIYGATVRTQIGAPINSFYGYRVAANSVYETSETAKNEGLYITDETGMKTYFGAGDIRFVDMNGDSEINEKDRVVIGNPNPDIYGNVFTSLSWKNLTLDANFNYSLGNDVFNYMRQQLESGARFMNQTSAMLNRWTNEGMVTNIPKATYGDPMGNARFSDRWIEDGSYLRMRSLTLSYKLPINNTYIQGITVWGQANNLFTLTKYLGTDPEFSMGNGVLMQGIDRGLLSQGRNFHLGVKINL